MASLKYLDGKVLGGILLPLLLQCLHFEVWNIWGMAGCLYLQVFNAIMKMCLVRTWKLQQRRDLISTNHCLCFIVLEQVESFWDSIFCQMRFVKTVDGENGRNFLNKTHAGGHLLIRWLIKIPIFLPIETSLDILNIPDPWRSLSDWWSWWWSPSPRWWWCWQNRGVSC